jgi:hypothetical protein
MSRKSNIKNVEIVETHECEVSTKEVATYVAVELLKGTFKVAAVATIYTFAVIGAIAVFKNNK